MLIDKANFSSSSTKRSRSPVDINASKRARNEGRRSLSISSISSSSLDRSPVNHNYQQKSNIFRANNANEDDDDDVIYIRSRSRSISPFQRDKKQL